MSNDVARKEWLYQRMSGLGGSEVSALLGMNPYMDIQKLYDIKTGKCEQQDISNVDAVKYGTEAEEPLRKLFELDFPQYQVKHEPFKIYRHEQYPFILGSLDGIIIDKETGEQGILEIKTTSILQSMQREKWNDRIPQNYFIQCLHYLLVTGFSFCILKAQLKTEYGGEIRLTTRHYIIKREDHLDDIEMLKNAEIDFWINNVMKGVRPALVLPSI
jgi:putative phage-type endonuclease